jgi:hypothetical protein
MIRQKIIVKLTIARLHTSLSLILVNDLRFVSFFSIKIPMYHDAYLSAVRLDMLRP